MGAEQHEEEDTEPSRRIGLAEEEGGCEADDDGLSRHRHRRRRHSYNLNSYLNDRSGERDTPSPLPEPHSDLDGQLDPQSRSAASPDMSLHRHSLLKQTHRLAHPTHRPPSPHADPPNHLAPPDEEGNAWTSDDDTLADDFSERASHKEAFAYKSHGKRISSTPLINRVRNNWARHAPGSSHGAATSCAPLLQSKRVRRRAGMITMVMALVFMSTSWYLWPMWLDERALRQAVDGTYRKMGEDGKAEEVGEWFGSNARVRLGGIKQVEALAEGLLPTKGGRDGEKRRLVVVGDVHGCYDELLSLLSKLTFSPSSDHLIFTGDLVAKGPSSSSVLALASSLNASCVRGNHEDRILLQHRDLHAIAPMTSPAIPPPPPPSSLTFADRPDSVSEILREDDGKDRFKRTGVRKPMTQADAYPEAASDLAVAKGLSAEHATYLQSCPLILTLPSLSPSLAKIGVVHAGLVPGVPLARQDPSAVMTMRTLDLATKVPSPDADRDGGVAWSRMWNKFQTRRKGARKGKDAGDEEGAMMVLYGHDAHRGLRWGEWTLGLDSGCVGGGRLSAAVVGEGEGRGWWGVGTKTGVGMRVESVRCRDYRVRR